MHLILYKKRTEKP